MIPLLCTSSDELLGVVTMRLLSVTTKLLSTTLLQTAGTAGLSALGERETGTFRKAVTRIFGLFEVHGGALNVAAVRPFRSILETDTGSTDMRSPSLQSIIVVRTLAVASKLPTVTYLEAATALPGKLVLGE
jgi:hypothetical protein